MRRATQAQYLLRFDDICPTMNWAIWTEIEALLVEKGLKPILAVVPDNRDPKLQVEPPMDHFWARVRAWQKLGWTIALHGFRHLYVSQNAGLVATRPKSEFAGLPAAEQREKLRRGIEIFQREGIATHVWIAPGNTFDETTVDLLPEFGIRVISGGSVRFPFVCSKGMMWVPQQLYQFRPAPAGVWTICFHHNEWSASDTSRFPGLVSLYLEKVASLADVLEAIESDPWAARLCTSPRVSRLLTRVELKAWNWWSSGLSRIEKRGANKLQASS